MNTLGRLLRKITIMNRGGKSKTLTKVEDLILEEIRKLEPEKKFSPFENESKKRQRVA